MLRLRPTGIPASAWYARTRCHSPRFRHTVHQKCAHVFMPLAQHFWCKPMLPTSAYLGKLGHSFLAPYAICRYPKASSLILAFCNRPCLQTPTRAPDVAINAATLLMVSIPAPEAQGLAFQYDNLPPFVSCFFTGKITSGFPYEPLFSTSSQLIHADTVIASLWQLAAPANAYHHLANRLRKKNSSSK